MISIYGFTSSQSSWIGTFYLLAGIVGGILASVFLTYQPKYKFCSIFITIMTLGSKIFTLLIHFIAFLATYYAILG